MTQQINDCSQATQISVKELVRLMDADPSHRLMKVLGKLEDLEGLLHVFYRSSRYVADVDNENAIFEISIYEGGDMALINVMSESLKKIYKEIQEIQSNLPENEYMVAR